jgi:vacuolar-type H+-ATPase subunit E/Vma4
MSTTSNKNKIIIKTIRRAVFESVQSVLNDPDYGLELKESFKKKVLKSGKSKGVISLRQAKMKYL